MEQFEKQKLLDYIHFTPQLIDEKMIERVTSLGVDPHRAYIIYLSLLCGFKENDQLLNELESSIIQLDQADYKGIYFDSIKGYDQIQFQTISKYQTILLKEEPLQMGYYTSDIQFPKYHDLMIDPGYIQQVDQIISDASGVVTLFGFGLGYLTYRLKECGKVDFIHIYERNTVLYSNFNDLFGCLGIVSLNELEEDTKFELGDILIIDLRSINESDLAFIQEQVKTNKKIYYVK